MSYEGQLMRGLKWYEQRDKNGVLPKGITNTEKINDVNTYLEFAKGKDEVKIKELLSKISLMARSRKKRLPQYKELIDELKSLGKKSDTKSGETKSKEKK